MPIVARLRSQFPDATPVGTYLDRVAAALDPFDFRPDGTFAAVSICRDELTQQLIEQVAQRWHRPFALGGLGGLPSLGRTGWQACLSHVPDADGRGHLLVFGLPHIGMDPAGELGQSLRRHQDRPTSTCGAINALLDVLKNGPAESLPPGLDDHEAQRLLRFAEQGSGTVPLEIVELTLRVAAAIEDEMWTELDALEAWRTMDVAVFCGLQIHVPERSDHVLSTGASVKGADGVRRPLVL
ncbi:MAG: hypothetical protein U0P47_12005 [Acidimicrobiales bacterium]